MRAVFHASGDLDDWSDQVINTFARTLAVKLGVDPNMVTLELAAGSVQINVTIVMADLGAAETAANVLSADVNTLSEDLGVSLVSITDVGIATITIAAPSPPPPSPPPPSPPSHPPSIPPLSPGFSLANMVNISISTRVRHVEDVDVSDFSRRLASLLAVPEDDMVMQICDVRPATSKDQTRADLQSASAVFNAPARNEIH